ncbi:hypothetical protein [Halorubrum sp. CBA1229]|uniref:hypothetical protein n=1 Tax=Halorubrum sp. CBA1229 TaxID=1853699 RepID=UPI0013150EAC|nr:hypothetical protein [Halorubrum sp. CBA1229]QKY15597.1 hypothetical protein Hrr1229_001395 [Halorubrum sp. CBA1229]
MIGDSPQFEDGTRNQRDRRLLDTRLYNIGRRRTRIRGRVVVRCASNVDIISVMWMVPPAKIYVCGIRIVEFVVVVCRPLNVDPGLVGLTEAICERHLEY